MPKLGMLVMGVVLSATVVRADEIAIRSGTSVRDVLAGQVGKGVVLRLRAGEEIGGKVQTVGEQVVHLTTVTGRDFYDAVVRVDAIDAVIVRVR